VAALRRSTLGGRGPYNDVVEQWDLNIRGADAVTAMSNVETLARLLDNAERFWRLGQNISPVRLRFAPQGSTLFSTANPAECLVLGRAPGDEIAGVSLPSRFNDVGMIFEVLQARLKFVRGGLWLNPTAETASSSAAANPTVQSATLTSTLTVSAPTKLAIAWSGTPTFVGAPSPIVLWASAANRIVIYEAESGSLFTNVTSVADAANNARGGSVARYTPINTSLNGVVGITLSGLDTNTRRVAYYAAVRNNSATTTWLMQVVSTGAETDKRTPIVPIDTSTTNPRIVFLGTLAYATTPTGIELDVQASAASGTLDVDYIVALAVDDERSGALALTWADDQPTTYTIDPRPLTATVPQASGNGALGRLFSYSGDAMIHTNGQVVAATILMTSGAKWRGSSGGGSVLNTTLTATRNNAYLTPR
jgi:hypothetical protein